MLRKFWFLFLCLVLSACATQRPKHASDYGKDLQFPLEAYPLVYAGQEVFDDPLAGILLRYADTKSPSDLITVYVYPIRGISWEEKEPVLKNEMQAVLKEVDYAVQVGVYQSRGEATESAFEVPTPNDPINGWRAAFSLVNDDGTRFDSFAYLFIQHDKFIKFRTSFNIEDSPNWSGDEVVKMLLPQIKVPEESEYMKAKRDAYLKQIADQIIHQLIEAAKDAPEESQAPSP